jgi:hypothetical protein
MRLTKGEWAANFCYKNGKTKSGPYCFFHTQKKKGDCELDVYQIKHHREGI